MAGLVSVPPGLAELGGLTREEYDHDHGLRVQERQARSMLVHLEELRAELVVHLEEIQGKRQHFRELGRARSTRTEEGP